MSGVVSHALSTRCMSCMKQLDINTDIYMSNRLYLEKKGIAFGWKRFFFQIHRAYGNEVGGNPKTR